MSGKCHFGRECNFAHREREPRLVSRYPRVVGNSSRSEMSRNTNEVHGAVQENKSASGAHSGPVLGLHRGVQFADQRAGYNTPLMTGRNIITIHDLKKHKGIRHAVGRSGPSSYADEGSDCIGTLLFSLWHQCKSAQIHLECRLMVDT